MTTPLLTFAHVLLYGFLLLMAGLLVYTLFDRRTTRKTRIGVNKLPQGASRWIKDGAFYLFALVVAGYVLWTLFGLTHGYSVAQGHTSATLRSNVFGGLQPFASHAEAKQHLGEDRYLKLVEQGYSLQEMATVLTGAPSDQQRIAHVRHVLQGDVLDRWGAPLIATTVDTLLGRMQRVYDEHPGLRRLLGEFNPSPERKTGLEWAYRETLVPDAWQANTLFQYGDDIQLSLDAELQKYCYEALRVDSVQRKGSVVVMNPVTGDVYAMVSSPGESAEPLADPAIEHLNTALVSVHTHVLDLVETQTSTQPTAMQAALQPVFEGITTVKRSLPTIEHRFTPAMAADLSETILAVDSVATYWYTAFASSNAATNWSAFQHDMDETLRLVDEMRRTINGVHLQVLRSRFMAHERLHFRQSRFSMGSALKPFVALWAEDLGIADTFRVTLRSARTYGVPRKILAFEQNHFSREDRRATFTVGTGLQRSLNTVFGPLIKIIEDEVGVNGVVQYFEELGFNQEIAWNTAHPALNERFPIYTSELYKERLYADHPEYYRANIYSLGIGAENMMRVTPLHVAMMGSYLANGAYLPTPKLEVDRARRVFARPSPNARSVRRVREHMRASVTHKKGTSHLMNYGPTKELYVAAKTGTSTRMLSPYEIDLYDLPTRKPDEEWSGYHSWSMALAGPGAHDVRAVVVVSIHDAVRAGFNPETKRSEWASRVAVPVTKNILTFMKEHDYFN